MTKNARAVFFGPSPALIMITAVFSLTKVLTYWLVRIVVDSKSNINQKDKLVFKITFLYVLEA